MVLLKCASSFPSGAPVDHCGDMFPSGHHGTPIYNSDSFHIIATPNDIQNITEFNGKYST